MPTPIYATFVHMVGKHRFVMFGVLYTLIVALVVGHNDQKTFPIGSPVYDLIDRIYLEEGMAPASGSKPWTRGEILHHLGRVSKGRLSQAGIIAYEAILDAISGSALYEDPDGFSFDTGITLALEGYASIPLAGESDADDPRIHGYEERLPSVFFPLEAWINEHLYLTSEFAIVEEHLASVGEAAEKNYLNWLDFTAPKIDIYFPFRGLASIGGPHWSIQYGRDKLSWGNGNTGNLMLSDFSDFYDYLSFTTFWNHFKHTSVYTVMDPYAPDGSNITYMAFLAHRFEFRIVERISVVVNEAMTFSNTLPDLIRDLNTMMVFHNRLIPERANSLLTIEVNYNPWRYFNVYGQVALDEIAIKYESDRTGGGGPPTFGLLAGIESAIPIASGYLDAFVEWAWTDPWLYNRKSAPYYANVRRYWSLITDAYHNVVKPIGYKTGPDAIVSAIGAAYEVPGKFSIKSQLKYLIKGENSLATPYGPEESIKTPVGTPQKELVLHLGGAYQVTRSISFGGNMYFQAIRNKDHEENISASKMELSIFTRLSI